jgi:tetratricopeptide (TPR) repeat protein
MRRADAGGPDSEAASPENSSFGASRKSHLWDLRVPVVCGLLVLAVAAVFGQSVSHDFVNIDDDSYVCANTHVIYGFSFDGIVWAFTHRHSGNWHPVTWLSHMLDCQFYGLWPGGHHLTNVVVHATTVVLLFLVLRTTTGQIWPSAFVAALFAVHPLRAESVAWVAERKDVLAGLFFVGTIGTYVSYIRRPFSIVRYLAVVFCFALGLMAKPMLVTLPALLLLLDYWPLGRLASREDPPDRGQTIRVLIEKLPLLALTVVSVGTTLWAQQGAMMALEKLPLLHRLGNAAVAYSAYLGKLAWPFDLAALYGQGMEESLSGLAVVGSLALLSIVSVVTVVLWRSHPYLLVGWLWYLGMLVPVIGIVQVGVQTMADRYTYLPQIGVGIALAWGGTAILRAVPYGRFLGGIAAGLLLAALTACACRQTSTWRNSETLWNHALLCNPNNYRAHCLLGGSYFLCGRTAEAIAHYQAALRLCPEYTLAYCRLGEALLYSGRTAEAVDLFRQALRIDPDRFEAHYRLGAVAARAGHMAEAAEHLQKALRVAPPSLEAAEAHVAFGDVLTNLGRFAEAIEHCRDALQMKPNDPEACFHLARALFNSGQTGEAIEQYRQAVRLKPDYSSAYNNLGNALLKLGRIEEAAQQYEQAVRVQPDYTTAHYNLGLCLVKTGRRIEALGHLEESLRLAEASGQKSLARGALAEIERLHEAKPRENSF